MSLGVHHRRAFQVLGATAAADAILGALFGRADHIGIAHGLYCATGFATTDGCDVTPHGWAAYTLGAAMMLSLIPLVGVVWAYVTTGLTASHIDKRHGEANDGHAEALAGQAAEIRAVAETVTEARDIAAEVHLLATRQAAAPDPTGALAAKLDLILRSVLTPPAAAGGTTAGESAGTARRTPRTARPRQEPT